MKISNDAAGLTDELRAIETQIAEFDYSTGTVDECAKELQLLKDRRDIIRHRRDVARRHEAAEKLEELKAALAELREAKKTAAAELDRITRDTTETLRPLFGDHAADVVGLTLRVSSAAKARHEIQQKLTHADLVLQETEREAGIHDKVLPSH